MDRESSWWARLRGWFRRGEPPQLDDTDSDLVVVVASRDPAEACSAALARSPLFVPGAQVVFRHHLQLPAAGVTSATELAAQDGYRPAPADAPELPAPDRGGLTLLTLQRVQLLDALHCSQERSRMAGLAQRRGGDVLGWDVLAAGTPTPEPGG